MKYAVLRTHGGLGNQLFQILFGRLFAERHGLTLCEVHDLRYRHAFPRSEALVRGGRPSRWQRVVSAARFPKLLQRYLGQAEVPFKLGRSVYLDGYFQRAECYAQFPNEAIARQLQRLADELNIIPAYLETRLAHLRVGDFFANRDKARAHVIERLQKMSAGASVMTNDESLLREPDVASVMSSRGVKLIGTEAMAAEEVLRTMAQYAGVDANGSTLAFWASVLGGARVAFANAALRETNEMLKKCLWT